MSIPFCPLQVPDCDLCRVDVTSLCDGLVAVWVNPSPQPLGCIKRSATMKIDVKETAKPTLKFADLKAGDVFRHPGQKALYRKLAESLQKGNYGVTINCVGLEDSRGYFCGGESVVETPKSASLAVEF